MIDPIVREAIHRTYEVELAQAKRNFEVAMERVKFDIISTCAAEVSQRMNASSTDTEFVIRIKR